jgi:hypothetical protein
MFRPLSRPCSRGFSGAASNSPEEIILDIDLTYDPLHGYLEGRFFGGYYDCYYYLPLYVFYGCHLLSQAAAGEYRCCRQQTRSCWPHTRIGSEPNAATQPPVICDPFRCCQDAVPIG